MNVSIFKRTPLLGILRGVEKRHLKPLVVVATDSGLEAIEVTMNSVGAAELIETLVDVSDGSLAVGAGTVLSKRDLDNALSAGASFIVTPVNVDSITKECRRKNVPVFPGALTPKEVHDAWQSGATMVKLFPAGCFGPKYIKELRGPFNDIKLLACGGINTENIPEYFASGVSAVAFGGSVFKKEWLDNGKYEKVGNSIAELVRAVHGCVNKF